MSRLNRKLLVRLSRYGVVPIALVVLACSASAPPTAVTEPSRAALKKKILKTPVVGWVESEGVASGVASLPLASVAIDAQPSASEALDATATVTASDVLEASAAIAPVASASSGLAVAPPTLAQRLGGRLLAVAQVGFAQARTHLVSERNLLNASARKVGIIGNHSGALIGNNSGGLIGNHAGGLISDRSGNYRLLQFPSLASQVSLTPLDGETAVSDRWWLDGRRELLFSLDGFNAGRGWRRVIYRGGGMPAREERFRPTLFWANNVAKHQEKVNTDFAADGTMPRRLAHASEQDASRVTTKVEIMPSPSSFIREPSTQVAVVFKSFVIDPVSKTGSFEYYYEHLDATEKGTLVGVEPQEGGKFVLDYADPLGTYDGESTLRDSAGRVVFGKRQVTRANKRVRTYDLQDGLSAELTQEEEDENWKGRAFEQGQQVALLNLVQRPNGSMLFTLILPDAPTEPLEFGYGIQDEPASTTPAYVEPPPLSQVSTLAGQVSEGFADGAGALARFDTLFGMAPSQRDPNLFYLADTNNHRIRTLRFTGAGGVQVATLAGNGEPAYVAGSLAETRLTQPAALTTVSDGGGGEILYLCELGGVIRRFTIGADGSGMSEFLAGTASTGNVDGPGSTASFNGPVGLACDPAANKLYVVDMGGHRVRAVDLASETHPVTTVAGSEDGFADGPASAALFSEPAAIAMGADGLLYIADSGNKRLRRMDPRLAAPVVETVVGQGITGRGFFDGPAATAGMNPPVALFQHPNGQWLMGGSDIRVFSPADGTLRTLAGGFIDGTADGDLEDARFAGINGFAVAPDGSLLVADGHRIRRIVPGEGQGPLFP